MSIFIKNSNNIGSPYSIINHSPTYQNNLVTASIKTCNNKTIQNNTQLCDKPLGQYLKQCVRPYIQNNIFWSILIAKMT